MVRLDSTNLVPSRVFYFGTTSIKVPPSRADTKRWCKNATDYWLVIENLLLNTYANVSYQVSVASCITLFEQPESLRWPATLRGIISAVENEAAGTKRKSSRSTWVDSVQYHAVGQRIRCHMVMQPAVEVAERTVLHWSGRSFPG